MNLNYDKIKRQHEHGGNTWTSYSDLFLVLSVVFLLLFTVANIRSGTMSMAQQAQLVVAKQEADELKRQIKAYDVLKDDYVQNGASPEEIANYHALMDHMDLLSSDARKDRDELSQKAMEADEKYKSLNKYQMLVKNIISANLVASGKVKKRDLMIGEKDNDIQTLDSTVNAQRDQIANNNQKIDAIQANLAKQIQETKYAYRSKKRSKESLEAAIKKLEAESQSKVAQLQQANQSAQAQLGETQARLEAKNREAHQLLNTMNDKQKQYEASISDLNATHEAQVAKERAEFDKSLSELKLSDEARIAQEKSYAQAAAKRNEQYQAKLATLNGELENTKNGIATIESKYKASINNLQASNQALAGDLAASQKKLNEQRILAEQISKNFKKAGIQASVDEKTGDVVINFKGEYFDTGRSDLKSGMKSILEQTFPVYAKSLMQNKEIASKIGSVEIVGFASPTYKGKSVDPSSLSSESRQAVNYNMDLSYRRAKAIFEHVFDTEHMHFDYQQTLLPLVKVSGRSYLATDKLPGRSTASLKSGQDYCSVFDCKKSQRVIIKFNLREE